MGTTGKLWCWMNSVSADICIMGSKAKRVLCLMDTLNAHATWSKTQFGKITARETATCMK
jgi:hypothetical protein